MMMTSARTASNKVQLYSSLGHLDMIIRALAMSIIMRRWRKLRLGRRR
jgi:hypothetical protein